MVISERSNLALQTSRTGHANRSWLPPIFDRQYFMNVGRIPLKGSESSIVTRYHPSVNFGNLPFANAIRANHYPASVQNAQGRNLHAPTWAMQTINNTMASVDPFEDVCCSLATEIASLRDATAVCGSHAWVRAVDCEDVFNRAPRLSQVVAQVVHSIKLEAEGSTFTQYAMMHWYWALWRWMLCPSKEHYRDIPELARPTPYQLFVSHPRVFDFIVRPSLRDLMCRYENPDVRWLTEGAATIECDRQLPLHQALEVNPKTGEQDLSPECKVISLTLCALGSLAR